MFKNIDGVIVDNERTREIITNTSINANLIYEDFAICGEVYYIEFYITEDQYRLISEFEDKEWINKRIYSYSDKILFHGIHTDNKNKITLIRIALHEDYSTKDLVNIRKFTALFKRTKLC